MNVMGFNPISDFKMGKSLHFIEILSVISSATIFRQLQYVSFKRKKKMNLEVVLFT